MRDRPRECWATGITEEMRCAGITGWSESSTDGGDVAWPVRTGATAGVAAVSAAMPDLVMPGLVMPRLAMQDPVCQVVSLRLDIHDLPDRKSVV